MPLLYSAARLMTQRSRSFLERLGPGLITGAADDDPSGIATYSQAGAQFGLGMLWSVLLTTPLMVGIQVVSARIGRVTGHGIARNLRDALSAPLLCSSSRCCWSPTRSTSPPTSARWARRCNWSSAGRSTATRWCSAWSPCCCRSSFPTAYLAPVLKWLTLSLFAYVAVLFTVDIPWGEAAGGDADPARRVHAASYLMLLVAVLGTTISPYLFFWQASQEVEEQRATDGASRCAIRRAARASICAASSSTPGSA